MSMWRKAMVALGLQDDEDDADFMGYDLTDDGDTYRTREQNTAREPDRITRPSAMPSSRNREAPAVRTIAADEPVRPSAIRTMPMTAPASPSVHVCEPKSFNDAQEVGERLKLGRPVIMNLGGLPRELQRRLIDFASGLAFAIDGSMSRVDDHVFLLSPNNMDVSAEEKNRIANSGLY
ncbi:MAG TPA: cell division protein SepF [Acidimicrobiia bacterium]|nr:cell division protein SepF [Acidimicrobiia bacterium]